METVKNVEKESLARIKGVENLHRVVIMELKNFKTLKSMNNKFTA